MKAFELGVVKQVAVYIGGVDRAHDSQLLRQLGIRTLVRCEYSMKVPWRSRQCPTEVQEHLIELRPCTAGFPEGMGHTRVKFAGLVDGVGNILFWCSSGGVVSSTIAAMFALSMWPWEVPRHLLLAMGMQDIPCIH